MNSLANALESYPQWQVTGLTGEPEAIGAIHAGLSHEVYLLQWDSQRMVIRLAHPNSLPGLNRESEIECLRNAHRKQLAPGLLYQNPEPHILVTEFIDGGHWTPAEAAQAVNLERLADLLGNIHALPAIDTVLVYEEVAARYWQALPRDQYGALVSPELVARLERVMRELDSSAPERVLCHNDLVLENLIDTGERLVALDWEYAAMGDPLFELAVISHNHQLNREQQRYLLGRYFNGMDDELEARFQRVLLVYLYLDCLWYAVQSILRPASGFAAIARDKAAMLHRDIMVIDDR